MEKYFLPTQTTLDILQGQKELFDIYARKEEYAPFLKDKYGRFPYYCSKVRDIFEPVVTRYLVENGFEPRYPRGKKFCVLLSHDIDVLPKEGLLPSALKYGRMLLSGEIIDRLNGQRKEEMSYLDFQGIMDLEERFGARSSFYFLAVTKGNIDHDYDVAALKGELVEITERGWEVGLHGSKQASDDLDEIVREKKTLESVLGAEVIGYRSHYLKFRVPYSWDLLVKAGFKYDTTLGYADCVGFRNGMCHPFKPYNLSTNHYMEIVEFPLIVMDGTLFDSYMRLDLDDAWSTVKRIIDMGEKYRGVITILWHNTSMQGDQLDLYKKILEYSRERNALMTSTKDLFESTIDR